MLFVTIAVGKEIELSFTETKGRVFKCPDKLVEKYWGQRH